MSPLQLRNTPVTDRDRKTPYILHSSDSRVIVTVYPGCPASLYVTHDNLTEEEVDAALLVMIDHIPSPCCVFVLPQCAASLLTWPQ